MRIKLQFKTSDQSIKVRFGEAIHIELLDACFPDYEGETTVIPSFEHQTLLTKETSMEEDIHILPIQVTAVSNPSGGITISI